MKRVLPFLSFIFISTALFAQEVDVTAEGDGRVHWSDEIKIYWLISIVVLSLFLVFRTFRDKPDA